MLMSVICDFFFSSSSSSFLLLLSFLLLDDVMMRCEWWSLLLLLLILMEGSKYNANFQASQDLHSKTTASEQSHADIWYYQRNHGFPRLPLFGVVFTWYWKTLMPSIPGGQWRAMAESLNWGLHIHPGTRVPHFESYCIHYAPSITFNTSVAYRANLFCAFLSALASSLITSTVYNFKFYGLVESSPQVGRKTTSKDKAHNKDVLSAANDSASYAFGSICAGTFYGFSPLVWTYAVGSEVFAMNNFFASYILYLTCKYVVTLTMEERSTSPLSHAYYGAFVFGLGLCNQHTLILYEVPL